MVLAATSYQWFLAFHILAAALWVGAGFCMSILLWRLQVASEPTETLGLLRGAGFMGDRVFAPLSLIIAVLGFILVAKGDWDWHFWLVFGLVGWLIAAVHGGAVLGKRHGPIAEALAAEGWSDKVKADFSSYLMHVRLDVLLIAVVLLDMVLKPGA